MMARWITSGIMIAATLSLGAVAQAEQIVDFTHLVGNLDFRAADTTNATTSIRSFSDTSLLNPSATGNEGAGESNTEFFGGFKAGYPEGQPDDGLYRLNSNDYMEFRVLSNGTVGRRSVEGMVIWNKAYFLNHSTTTVVFNAASSMSLNIFQGTLNIGFVVNDGGTYYVSDMGNVSGAVSITNMAAATWATISTDGNYTIGETATTRTFTDVQGVGFYLNERTSTTVDNQLIVRFDDFQVSATTPSGDPPPPIDIDIDFANIFANGCVLQRDQTVPVWGTATPGDMITVEINGQSKQGIADGQGNWRIELDPETAGGPYTLMATGGVSGPAELTQVYFGDVWIMTGQSNMEQNIAGQVKKFSDDYPAVPDNSDNFDDMRFAIVDEISANAPADDVSMERSWNRWQKSALGSMSTVGYFFARALNEQLDANGMADVPLGFIRVCEGGTSIEEWMAEDKWRAAKTANPGLIVASDASGYYNGMIAPIQDYAIKGAIWYQGEGNTASITRVEQYPILKQTLVDSWREQWNNPDMPFYFVQLAPYKAYTPLPADELWAWMRESQASCQSISNTAMACIIDGGYQGEIHPPFKDRAGDRLARLALDRTYGIATVHRGPTLQDVFISGSAATITFDHVAAGLETRAVDSQPDADEIAEGYLPVSVSSNELAGFFLCGADKRFYPALEAVITASNQVQISNAADVPLPVAVRYAFQDYPRCNLFNSEGLPAEPFRTDNYAFGEAQAETNGYTFWKYETFSQEQLSEILADPETDSDNDGMSLFLEYALGGNPLVHDAADVLPTHDLAAAHLVYRHNERTDDPGLTYTVQLSTNLVSNVWKTNGVEFVGEAAVSNGWKTVTNRTDVGDVEFMRLIIE